MEITTSLDQIVDVLKQNETKLRRLYGIERIGVFGSIVRGQAGNESDIDLLVEFSEEAEIGLLRFIEIERYLGQLLGRRVDLVEKGALKPFLGKKILKEVVYP